MVQAARRLYLVGPLLFLRGRVTWMKGLNHGGGEQIHMPKLLLEVAISRRDHVVCIRCRSLDIAEEFLMT